MAGPCTGRVTGGTYFLKFKGCVCLCARRALYGPPSGQLRRLKFFQEQGHFGNILVIFFIDFGGKQSQQSSPQGEPTRALKGFGTGHPLAAIYLQRQKLFHLQPPTALGGEFFLIVGWPTQGPPGPWSGKLWRGSLTSAKTNTASTFWKITFLVPPHCFRLDPIHHNSFD